MADERSRSTLHVYNARCALTIEPSRNRAGTVHTVNLETAARDGASADFDWHSKQIVQVTGSELADVVAAVLGHRDAVEFLHHGRRRDKGYRLFHDGGRFVVQLFSGTGERHSVSLAPADRLAASVVLFRQLQRNHGGLPADVLYAMLERIYTRPHGATATPSPQAPATRLPTPTDGSPPSPIRADPVGVVGEDHDDGASAPIAPDPYDW